MKRLTVRIPDDESIKLELSAVKNGRSLNSELVMAIRAWNKAPKSSK